MELDDDGLVGCLVISDAGHVLAEHALRPSGLRSAPLASLVATLQQFNHGQPMAMLMLQEQAVVVASSTVAPILAVVVCVAESDAGFGRLVGACVLDACTRYFGHAALDGLVASLKKETEAQATTYTLSSALEGQAPANHTAFGAFEATVLGPFLGTAIDLKRSLQRHPRAFFLNSNLSEVLPPTPLASALLHGILCVARDAVVAATGFWTARPIGSRHTTYVGLASFGIPGYCAAVIYEGPDEWFDALLPPTTTTVHVPHASPWSVAQGLHAASARFTLEELCASFAHHEASLVPESPRQPEPVRQKD
ncbi:hypothetical protein SDRG_14443 [Saprolegnia diclina VS20]|uniref:Uncharacterized protein n=1 Tax=Saprolegnia diclina (strain VS20) TaxID=1156394 RepID=T0R740_SAPDV|nr:hypothetical protein SDRG_14443 [Saprolegnia diclina VS20]EQC27863.1 hypothetical protein SDRG_14443 [Saprolegnia diclina VS20]|eukprot:XP_008618793.1 hypothetical protein SDRG_14443 [Saprolegnia diclina VS20]